mgnify:CR=1 FL=1
MTRRTLLTAMWLGLAGWAYILVSVVLQAVGP